MDPRLQHLLIVAKRRLIRLRTVEFFAWESVVTAIVLGCLWFGGVSISLSWLTTIGLGGLVLSGLWGIAMLVSARRAENLQGMSQRIEGAYPDLDQRLLTAIDQRPDAEGNWSYLQRRLASTVLQHHRHTGWAKIATSRRLLVPRLIIVASLCLTILSLWGLSSRPRLAATKSSPTDGLLTGSLEIAVDPGNAEVERGMGMAMTATFDPDKLPSEATLVVLREGTENRLEMNRNLADPVFGIFLPGIESDFAYHVEAGNLRSPAYHVTVFEYPRLVQSDATIVPPEYAQQASKTIEDTLRVTVIEGSHVTWSFLLNKEVQKACLIDEQGVELLLSQHDNASLRYDTTIVAQKSHKWKLHLVDRAGRSSKIIPEIIIRTIPNRPAEIKLTTATDATVSPLEELPLQAEVRDDFGLQRIGIRYSIDGQEEQELELPVAEGSETAEPQPSRRKSTRVRHVVDFEQLQAKPDQLLSYHFWAEDVGTTGERRRTTSPLYFAEVRPFEQVFREGEGSSAENQPSPSAQNSGGPQAQQAEELAALQKQIVAAIWNLIRRRELMESPSDSPLTPELIADTEVIAQSQRQAREQLDQLSQALPPDRPIEEVQEVADHMDATSEALQQSVAAGSPEPWPQALREAQRAYAAMLRLRARQFDVMQSRQQSSQNSSRGSSSRAQMQRQLDQLELKNDPDRYERQQTAQEPPASTQDPVQEILSRLRDLARRQGDLNEQLKSIELALQMAKTAEEKAEARRQLEKLREQQQELLQDTDELDERLREEASSDRPAAQTAQEASEQLQQTRQQLRDAEQSLAQSDPSSARSAGSRAQRALESMRENLQAQTAAGAREQLQQMRQSAEDLARQQRSINEAMKNLDDPAAAEGGLRAASNGRAELAEQLLQQSQQSRELLQQIQEAIRATEESQPLVADKLYEAQREAQQNQLTEHLQMAGELLRRGLDEQADQAGQIGSVQLQRLDEQIQRAASQVLGDPAEGLRRASAQLDNLAQGLSAERTESSPESAETPPSSPSADVPPTAPAAGEASGESIATDAESDREGGSVLDGFRVNPQSPTGEGQPTGEGLRPITGEGFREWSDSLREVEEMLDSSDLRSRAAGIRDRARELRRDFLRHSQQPQWSEIEDLLARPLRELQKEVTAELLRRSAERNALVPMDRDAVPEAFRPAVQRYYEQLGAGR